MAAIDHARSLRSGILRINSNLSSFFDTHNDIVIQKSNDSLLTSENL